MTTYDYDRNSNVLDEVSTDASTGLKTHTKYVRDARGRVLEVIAPQGMSRTYDYEAHDRPGTIGLAGDRRVGLDYDGLGRPTTVRFTGPDDTDAIGIQQVWSDSSRLVARIDPNGNTTRYATMARTTWSTYSIRTARWRCTPSTAGETAPAGRIPTATP